MECKCTRELHDLYHEDFVNIRQRLGWEEPDDVTLHCHKDTTLKAGYTWIPPGVSLDTVSTCALSPVSTCALSSGCLLHGVAPHAV